MAQRTYSSPLRARAAEQTRQAILAAARTLFADQGYGRTSVAAIAAAAGVALNTVYSSVGGKPALILAMAREATDDEQTDRTVRRVATLTDGHEILQITAAGTGEVITRHAETLAALQDARNSESEVAAAAHYAMRHYRNQLDTVADRLATIGALHPNLPTDRARDILWFYLGAPAWSTIQSFNWPLPEAATWLGTQAATALLKP